MESPAIPKTCPLCGETTPPPAAFCSHCGQPLKSAGPARSATSKWYHNVWFVLFMLFFVLGPFGLPLVWKNPRFSRWVKIGLSIAMVVYTLALVDVMVRAVQAVMAEVRNIQSTF